MNLTKGGFDMHHLPLTSLKSMKRGLVTAVDTKNSIAYAMFSGKLPDNVAIYPWNRGFPKISTRKEHRGRNLGVRIASSDRVYAPFRSDFEIVSPVGKEVLCRITLTESGYVAIPWVLYDDVRVAFNDIYEMQIMEKILSIMYPKDRR